MTDEQLKPTPWLWWTVAGLILLLVVYPLSIGPVGWFMEFVGLDDRNHWTARLLRIVYAPVLMLGHSSPDAEEIMRQYLLLWMKHP
ncbi:MAG: hypothetical protein JWN70_6539 [Planctomycetaceae bacterium]|nr:hypothetical protein [Planctomycetaceae bacterium]